ncbi:MAG TPA: hypothetical protein VFP91_01730, partial [Vicinamibacterales bacterium]|nr:hypothetical protein [Vicinamibacterales bacterium]
MIFRLLAIVIAGALAAPAAAADGVISNWMSGTAPSAKTYVFKTHDNTFIGTVCGPCDDPSTVFRVADGVVLDATHVSFSIVGGNGGPAASTIGLTRVDGEGSLMAIVKSVPAPTTARLDGRWVAAGRVAQQNVTLKLRDGNTVWGVICGPCDKPAGVFLIEDGMLDGDTISFFIHHTERRNFMKGVIGGNVMKFKWVREGHESEPGGEMTLIGPIR